MQFYQDSFAFGRGLRGMTEKDIPKILPEMSGKLIHPVSLIRRGFPSIADRNAPFCKIIGKLF
jgi:hypothetical protein